MRKTLIAMGVLSALSSTAALAADDSAEARIAALEAQLAELKKMVQSQAEGQKNLKKEIVAVAEKPSGPAGFSYGGFIKVDAMYDDFSDGPRANAGIGDEILVPSVIPVGTGEGDTRFNSHIKTSRFWMKSVKDTDAGKLTAQFELDFLTGDGDERISNSAHSRVRHAFVKWDYDQGSSLLAGQTWSTLMNTGALPESVEFIGPTSGVIFNRQAQIRWTTGNFQFALENPSSSYINGGNNLDDNTTPDFIARYNGSAGILSYSISGIAREIAINDGSNDEDEYGFGLSLAGKLGFNNGDDLKFQFNHGTLGRYLALQPFRDAVIEDDGSIDTIDQTGGYIAYRHLWSPKLRSTFQYATSSTDNPDGFDTATKKVTNYNINLLYSPTAKLTFGAEYIKAERELENGDDGDLTRIQLMTKYAF